MPKSLYIRLIATLGIVIHALAGSGSAGDVAKLCPGPTFAAREGPGDVIIIPKSVVQTIGNCQKA
jgi:hypothetical protein